MVGSKIKNRKPHTFKVPPMWEHSLHYPENDRVKLRNVLTENAEGRQMQSMMKSEHNRKMGEKKKALKNLKRKLRRQKEKKSPIVFQETQKKLLQTKSQKTS
jgi:hypothetical protein